MAQIEANQVKWGIMGTGWIAERFVEDLQHVSSGKAVAVGSRTLENARKFADKFQISRAYSTYEELLQDSDVDAVYVATPHPAHRDNVLAALSAGKAVLCEKPFTVNSKELEELIALAKAKNLFLMEAMWTRYLPPIIQVREWIAEGRIGEVKLVKADFGFDTDWNPEGRLLNPQLGGGALLDVGIYPVSFASMIFGPRPQGVYSTVHLGETGVDEHFSILLDYGQGKSAALNGAVRLGMTNEAYIYGTKGMIHIPSFHDARSATLRVEGEEAITVTDDRPFSGYAYEAEEVARCLANGKTESEIIPLEESLGILRLLDQVRGQWGLKYPFE